MERCLTCNFENKGYYNQKNKSGIIIRKIGRLENRFEISSQKW